MGAVKPPAARRSRLLLPALLLALVGLVVVVAPAQARCPDVGGTVKQAERASDVFTGTLGDQRRHGDERIWTVTVDRVYKGTVDTAQVQVHAPSTVRACGLVGSSGEDYVFFARREGDRLRVFHGDGTGPATTRQVAKVEDLLGAGHVAVPAEPEQAVFTQVAGEPTDVGRLVAPGVALVIVGVLGFALVAWRGRRQT
jgi:hypothetical protein